MGTSCTCNAGLYDAGSAVCAGMFEICRNRMCARAPSLARSGDLQHPSSTVKCSWLGLLQWSEHRFDRDHVLQHRLLFERGLSLEDLCR